MLPVSAEALAVVRTLNGKRQDFVNSYKALAIIRVVIPWNEISVDVVDFLSQHFLIINT
jgi:hypothetical protein